MKRSVATRYAKKLDKLVRQRNEQLRQWVSAPDIRKERDFFAELAVELRRLAAKKGKKKQSKVGA